MRQGRKRRRSDQQHNRLKKLARRFAGVPLAIMAVAWVVFAKRESLPVSLPATLTMASFIVAAVGMALSAGFNRSRVFFALLLVAQTQLVLSLPAPSGLEPQIYASEVYYFAGLLLAVNILAFAFWPERGLLTPGGRSLAFFLVFQLAVAAVIIMSQDREIAEFIRRDALSPGLSRYTPLPLTVAAAFGAAFLLLAGRQLKRSTPVGVAFVWAVPVLAAALHYKGVAVAQPLFFAAATVMLSVAALQESYAIAYQDELTGLPSRRALTEELGRLGDRYSVAMVDLDHFKKLNDTYGHDVGDDVLRLTAALIQECSEDGRPFRYGGEEFTILFPGMGVEEAWPVVEALRAKIAQRSFFVRGKEKKRLTLTVSIGLAERGRLLTTPQAVLKAADEALYRAKEGGRNRVST